MLKLESGTPKTALSKADKEVTEIFLHPELGIHARGNFGVGRVGLVVAHGAMALYDQDTADEVDRMCAHKMELLVPAQPWPFNPVAHWVDADDPIAVALTEAGQASLMAGDSESMHIESKNEGVKGPDSPLVGPKIRHNPRKKKGGIADL